MSDGGVMLSGWLKKSPPEKKMRRHAWKKRWFVLKSGRLYGDPNVLEYYKHQTAKKPIKIINLNDCIQIDINVPRIKPDKKEASQHFVFDIVTGNRKFYFVADSVREMSTWVHCLCDLCGFNHDSNDKTDLGTEHQVFSSQPVGSNMNGTSSASTLLAKNETDIPVPLPRPQNTMSQRSKPLPHRTEMANGSDNPAWSQASENGYDFPEEDDSNVDGADAFSKGFPTRPNGFPGILPTVMHPPEDPDMNGYLHLADCETVPSSSAFLDVSKNDERRCSTDSVFEHEGPGEDSPAETSPTSMISPLTEIVPQNSRFLQKVNQGRLSSMPDCPPPLPPTNVPPHGYRYPPLDDEEEDNVTDARRKPSTPRRSNFVGRLPPIDDPDTYKVPLNLQREYRVNEDGKPTSGSTGGNSSSSYGSTGGGHGDGRRSSGKFIVAAPEYINTSESSFSGPGGGSHLPSASGSSIFSSPAVTPNSAAMLGGKILYDAPSPMSPIFPLQSGPGGHMVYQAPSSLTHITQHTSPTTNMGILTLESRISEKSVKRRLEGVHMLDVGAMSPGGTNAVSPGGPNAMYSAPSSLPLATESVYSSAHELSIDRRNEPMFGGDKTYDIPPARPPKPLGAGIGRSADSPSHANYKINTEQNKLAESFYSTPRTHSSSSSSSNSKEVGPADRGNAVYDTVKQLSPLSPVHTTVVGTISDDQRLNKMFPSSKPRNAISASNSPLATPNMSRRIGIGKTPSFNSKISQPIQQNKGVSGSAPSLYDVPQQLRSSPFHPEARSSQSSSASADSSSARNSAVDGIYDMPKRHSEGRSSSPKPPPKGPFQKVDDLEHPSYERMSTQHLSDNGALDMDDHNHYTAMAGANTLTGIGVSYTSPLHHSAYPTPAWPKDAPIAPDNPPPVHRDLKPGRRSLGSDGGSSQTSSDKRKNNSRDSYESDEAISPPHTSIVRTMPIVTEPKSSLKYGPVFGSLPTAQTLGPNPHGRVDSLNDRLSVSPTPPQRPPKSSLSPRSPPMATQIGQLPGRPYTPTHGSHGNSQTPHDRHFMTPSPSLSQGAPERPPKPDKMREQRQMKNDMSNTQVWDDGGFSPPRRPPKPSMTTPSSGDSSVSSLHSGAFFPNSHMYNSTSLVPPAPPEYQQELKYIEIKDFPTQGNTPVHPPLDFNAQEKTAPADSVEYYQLDVDKTLALEKMKLERLQQQQRANSEGHTTGKGKDKFK